MNMFNNWKNYFLIYILQRGQQYYENGHVLITGRNDVGSIITAEVQGSRRKPYKVMADFRNPDRFSMSCTCAYAKDGSRCKHMAALLYKLESEKTERAIKPSQQVYMRPFAEVQKASRKEAEAGGELYKEEYRYFSMSRIASWIKVQEIQLEEARKLISSGQIRLLDLHMGYLDLDEYGYMYRDHRNANELLCQLHAIYNPEQKDQNNQRGRNGQAGQIEGKLITILFGQNGLVDIRCDVRECYLNRYFSGRSFRRTRKSYEFCVHEIAGLLLMQEYLTNNQPGDATDRLGSEFLNRYRSSGLITRNHSFRTSDGEGFEDNDAGQVQILPVKKKLYLEPRFHEYYGEEIAVDFRIGTDRLFVLKSLRGLVDAVTQGGSMHFGKSTEIHFEDCEFDRKSREYYDFIFRCVQEERHRSERMRRYDDEYSEDTEIRKGEIPLYGSKLDEFFALSEEETIADASGGTSKNITFIDADYRPAVRIEPERDKNGQFQGIRVMGQVPEMYQGIRNAYYIKNGNPRKFCRISADNLEKIRPLIDMADMGKIDFCVGRRNLSLFIYHILPLLRETADVTETGMDEVFPYLPPEVAVRFYLDAEENRLTCRVEAAYGEDAFALSLEDRTLHKEAFRDLNTENAAVETAHRLFPEFDPAAKEFSTGRSNDAVYDLLDHGIAELLKIGQVHATSAFDRLRIRRRLHMRVGVSIENDMMELDILSDDLSREELLEVLESYRRRRRYHRLKNGEFVDLEGDAVSSLMAVMEAAHLSPREFVKGKMQIPIYRALYLDKMLEEHEEIAAKRDKTFRNLIRSFKSVRDSDFEVPESLQPIIRGYQKYGFRWMMTLSNYGFGGILADDMGLGKTLQMIAVLLARKEMARKEAGQNETAQKEIAQDGQTVDVQTARGQAVNGQTVNGKAADMQTQYGTSLVVCPASLVYNWLEEIRRYAPDLKAGAVAGTKAERRKMLNSMEEYDVLVTSYDLLKRDIDDYEGKKFFYQVIDEAQYIKNPSAAASKSVKVISAKHRFALTGTPIENRLSELWSIFDYLMPGFLYQYETFKTELETPITRNHDEEAMERLKKMTSPFILRRLKTDVLKDLPDKLEETRYAAFEPRQRKLYDGQVVHMQQMLAQTSEENFNKSKIQILAELTRLRQICCDPSLLVEDYNGSSAKREALMDMIRGAIDGGHRMLVFSQFTSMLDLIEKDLAREGISYYIITGATPKQKRTELVKAFNEGDVPVFLISLKAGGTGLNLVGADIVIHYDPWWNLAVQNQATDRAHRIGQTKVVSVYKLIVKDTIEEKIVKLQETKKNLADEILSGDHTSLSALSKEELMDLISG